MKDDSIDKKVVRLIENLSASTHKESSSPDPSGRQQTADSSNDKIPQVVPT
jgi:hypothetical protein